jgi:Arc/MetJ family transcription regulator
MRRTVVIDDQLLEEARRLLGTKGIRETVEAALREAVRRQRLEELQQSLGNLELDLDLKALMRMRDEE